MAATGDIPNQDTMGGIANLISLISGKTTTTTKNPNISQEGINAMLQQLLGSNQGLASITSGQNSSGMYNSSVNTQLTNDLLSRVTGQVAALNAPETTTQKVDPIVNPKLALGALALGTVGNNLGLFGTSGTGSGGTGTSNILDSLSKLFSGFGTSPTSGSSGNNGIIGADGGSTGYFNSTFADSLAGAFDKYYSTGDTSFFDSLTGTSKDGYYPDLANNIWGSGLDTSGTTDWSWLNSLSSNENIPT